MDKENKGQMTAAHIKVGRYGNCKFSYVRGGKSYSFKDMSVEGAVKWIKHDKPPTVSVWFDSETPRHVVKRRLERILKGSGFIMKRRDGNAVELVVKR